MTANLSVRQTAGLDVRLLPVSSIRPNDYNPNAMTGDEFAELLAEVRHLGRLPKPIIVTRHADGWEIVDGEHSWRAASEVGLTEVTCEVIEADLFEAMRQTYKRNQHGRHHPVRLGRMFLAMMETWGLSRRDLAAQMTISEGTIRNAIMYASAATSRNGYATQFRDWNEDSDGLIAKLTVRQVREYVRLPAPIRDEWLDAGADPRTLARAAVVRPEEEGKTHLACLDDVEGEMDGWQELVEAGLGDRITASDFVGSTHEAFRLLLFRKRHQAHVDGLDAYLRPLVDWCVPSHIADYLPCRPVGARIEMLVSPAQWSDIVRDCAKRAVAASDLDNLIQVSTRLALEDAGLEARDVSDPRTIEAQRAVSRAPAFIRESSLSLRDQHVLTLLLSKPDAEPAAALEAVRRAGSMLEGVRGAARAGCLQQIAPALLPLLRDPTPLAAFDLAVAEIERERAGAECRAIIGDRQRLTEVLTDKFGGQARSAGPPEGDALRELLSQRLAAVPTAELQLLGAAALGWEGGLAQWMDTVMPSDVRTEGPDSQEVGDAGN